MVKLTLEFPKIEEINEENRAKLQEVANKARSLHFFFTVETETEYGTVFNLEHYRTF